MSDILLFSSFIFLFSNLIHIVSRVVSFKCLFSNILSDMCVLKIISVLLHLLNIRKFNNVGKKLFSVISLRI